MPMKSPSKFVGVAVATCVLCATTPALAGFQWTPPAAPLEIIEAPAPVTAPAATIIEGKATDSPEIVSPVVIEGTAPVNASAPVVSPKPELQPVAIAPEATEAPQQIAVAPPSAAPTPLVRPPAPALVTPAKSEPAVVRGFANRVPLTVALRQLLPSAYSFSIDEDVDMGVLVSFKGGKPWHDTLIAALQPVGLTSHDQGQMVVISRMEATPAKEEVPVAAETANPIVFDNVPASVDADAKPVEIASAAPVMVEPPVPVIPPAPTFTPHVSAPVAAAPAPVASAPVVVTPAVAPVVMPEATPTLIAAASAKTEAVKIVEMWTADRGDSLRKVLTNWSKRVNVELEWLAEYDYPLQASVNLTGSYEDAVRNLLSGFEGARPQPVGQLHANTGAGQKVLVVRARGNTNKD